MGQAHDVRWIPAYNSGSYEVPQFGLVQLAGATYDNVPDRMYVNVQRPASSDCTPFAINSHKPIPAGGYGLVTIDGPVFAYYDTSETPANGETWGPTVDSFKATKGFNGLEIIGAEDSSREIVLIDFKSAGGDLIGGCLDENHPGRGTAFDLHIGTWDSSADEWEYDTVTVVKGIDWRYDVPYPDAGTTGLFKARPSDTYGTIYEAVALDCDSPGECGD